MSHSIQNMRTDRQTYSKASGLHGRAPAVTVIYIIVLCAVICLVTTKGITDEATISLDGDMPRYLMNGVYLCDVISDFPIANLVDYTYQYYARYPALSLGHHPLLPGIAEVPFYFIFGISVLSARLTTIFFALFAGIAFLLLAGSVYDDHVAFLSSLIFVTTPFIVRLSRIMLSELPALALLILSTYFFYQYVKLDRNKYSYAFAFCFVLAMYAKQTAVYMIPAYFFYFLLAKGPRKLIAKEVLVSSLIIIMLTLPLVFITLKFSQFNVTWTKGVISSSIPASKHLYVLKFLWNSHLTLSVLLLSLISTCSAIYRKDERTTLLLLWIMSYYVCGVYIAAPLSRHFVYWVPAFCLLAGSVTNLFDNRRWKILLSTILMIIVGYQITVALQLEPDRAEGYEQAAKYVVENRKGESVLFNGMVDTGYFPFFVRKHDPHKRLIVLRANKMLVTTRMDRIVEERITSRQQIYEILNDFGVGYVVTEDKETGSPPLEWLRHEVKSDRFVLRKKIPMLSNHPTLRDVSLSIYEYKGYTRPTPGTILKIDVPLISDSITVRLDDLLHKQ